MERTVYWWLCLLVCGGPLTERMGRAQERESLTGEKAAQALKDAAEAEAGRYNIHWGPVSLQTGASVRAGYTDNVFYTEEGRKSDVVIIPEVKLTGFARVSEINTLKLSLGVGYEYYLKNSVLNGDLPLVNPDSELSFNIFVGNLHLRLHEKFSYQETLLHNSIASAQDSFFNFNNVGVFKRWDNFAGVNADWDLNRLILSVGYDHENFDSSTPSYEYLNRASEWLTASASFLIGDKAQIGLESQGGRHHYETQTTLNDHWQVRGGPFVDLKTQSKLSFRAGGGYDTARYDAPAGSSDFETYYAYGRVSQETRLFTHSLSAGHEHQLGDNANNLETTYIRYAITSSALHHWELGANVAVLFAEEFGGTFREHFTYPLVGLRVGYQIHKYWRTDLAYEFLLKDSDLALRSFYGNRVTLGLGFSF